MKLSHTTLYINFNKENRARIHEYSGEASDSQKSLSEIWTKIYSEINYGNRSTLNCI